MDALGSAAYVYRLSPADLGLSSTLEAPGNLYLEGSVSVIYRALERVFNGPYYAVIEAGRGDLQSTGRGRLHVHVIAHREDGPHHIRRDTERCKQVYDAPGLYRYLAKPPEPYSLEAEMDYTAAKALSPTGKLPRTRRHFIGRSRLVWAHSYCSIEPNALPAPDPLPSLDPSLDQARADSIPARATRDSTPSSPARGHMLQAQAVWDLLVMLESTPGAYRPPRAALRVPDPPKVPIARLGRINGDIAALRNYPWVSQKPLKSSLLPSRTRKAALFGRATASAIWLKDGGGGHVLRSLVPPPRRSLLERLVYRLRAAFFSKETKIRSSIAPPIPTSRRAEKLSKPLLEESPADIRIWSTETVSAALRRCYEGSEPSPYGGFTHVVRPDESRSKTIRGDALGRGLNIAPPERPFSRYPSF